MLKNIYILIFIIASFIFGFFISYKFYPNNSSNLDELNEFKIRIQDSLIVKNQQYIDSLNNRIVIKEKHIERIIKIYDTVKINIPYYSDEYLDSLIFKEPRFNPLLQ